MAHNLVILLAWASVILFMCAKFFSNRWDATKKVVNQKPSEEQKEYESEQSRVLKERLSELKEN